MELFHILRYVALLDSVEITPFLMLVMWVSSGVVRSKSFILLETSDTLSFE